MAQMESRRADRRLWKRKLKITEQLKENKRGFIGHNCLKRERGREGGGIERERGGGGGG